MATTRRRSQRGSQRSTSVRVQPADAGARPAAEAKTTQEIDWQTEYAYIGKDLRQLAIVSTILFALLLIGGLFI
ncbi:MAG TPA: hypothetical protein VNK95_12650 [Caldilineaceae bacterium]|nr:hypothetical protein [Caldilineaceae bacterium]